MARNRGRGTSLPAFFFFWIEGRSPSLFSCLAGARQARGIKYKYVTREAIRGGGGEGNRKQTEGEESLNYYVRNSEREVTCDKERRLAVKLR